uniref:Uncharacterized protein n=1 Tax=viral metagenome TaxID=1070528 RepID=A0A6C0J961_9ZZZZ
MHDFILRHLHDKKIKKIGNYFIISIEVSGQYDYIDLFKFIQINAFFFKSTDFIDIMCICKTLFDYILIKWIFMNYMNCTTYATDDPVSFCLLESSINKIDWNIFLSKTGSMSQNVSFFNYSDIYKNI